MKVCECFKKLAAMLILALGAEATVCLAGVLPLPASPIDPCIVEATRIAIALPDAHSLAVAGGSYRSVMTQALLNLEVKPGSFSHSLVTLIRSRIAAAQEDQKTLQAQERNILKRMNERHKHPEIQSLQRQIDALRVERNKLHAQLSAQISPDDLSPEATRFVGNALRPFNRREAALFDQITNISRSPELNRKLADNTTARATTGSLVTALEEYISSGPPQSTDSGILVEEGNRYGNLFKLLQKKMVGENPEPWSPPGTLQTSSGPVEIRPFRVTWNPKDKSFFLSERNVSDYDSVLTHLSRLWDQALTLPDQPSALRAIAEFEWLFVATNPTARAGASLGDVLSLALQRSRGLRMRPGFQHIDFEVFTHSQADYVERRVTQLLPLIP